MSSSIGKGFRRICAIVIWAVCSISSADPPRPNILFIGVDDLKPLLGAYGVEGIRTPNIDALGEKGFLFLNNHCQQAVCSPSRASLLTGKRPDYIRMWDLNTMLRSAKPDILTLPQHFKNNGYKTAAVGKIFDVRSVDKDHDARSWTIPYRKIEASSPIGGGWVYETERVSTEAPVVEDSATMDGQVLAESMDLLDEMAAGGSPFFLAVGFHKPHLPFVAPKKYWDLYDRETIDLAAFREHSEGTPEFAFQPGWEIRSLYTDIPEDYSVPISEEKQRELIHGYYACVSFIDAQVGRLLSHLEELGVGDETIVVLWGDHGWHLGDHGMWCKHTNFEQATRSPLIFAGPDVPVGNTNAPTEFIDIFPTLCTLAGLDVPDHLDGDDLVSLMNGNPHSGEEFAVSQYPRRSTMMGYAFRNERFRYVIWMGESYRTYEPFSWDLVVAEELYDYAEDPLETVNLVASPEYSEVRRTMSDTAVGFFSDQYDKFQSE